MKASQSIKAKLWKSFAGICTLKAFLIQLFFVSLINPLQCVCARCYGWAYTRCLYCGKKLRVEVVSRIGGDAREVRFCDRCKKEKR